jgi:hypothetical protein
MKEKRQLSLHEFMLYQTGATQKKGNQGQLNPALSRWLMGYPPSWCVAAVKAYRKIKSTRTRRRKGA